MYCSHIPIKTASVSASGFHANHWGNEQQHVLPPALSILLPDPSILLFFFFLAWFCLSPHPVVPRTGSQWWSATFPVHFQQKLGPICIIHSKHFKQPWLPSEYPGNCSLSRLLRGIRKLLLSSRELLFPEFARKRAQLLSHSGNCCFVKGIEVTTLSTLNK